MLCTKPVLKENFYECEQSDDVGFFYKQNWTIVSSAYFVRNNGVPLLLYERCLTYPTTRFCKYNNKTENYNSPLNTSMVLTDAILAGSFYRINCIITWNDIHTENFTQMPQEFNIVKYCHQLQTQFFGRIIL